jgi:hypothetical protein
MVNRRGVEVSVESKTKEGLMITVKSQFLQLTLPAVTFVVVVGALSMIWPGIIALFLGALWLL